MPSVINRSISLWNSIIISYYRTVNERRYACISCFTITSISFIILTVGKWNFWINLKVNNMVEFFNLFILAFQPNNMKASALPLFNFFSKCYWLIVSLWLRIVLSTGLISIRNLRNFLFVFTSRILIQVYLCQNLMYTDCQSSTTTLTM